MKNHLQVVTTQVMLDISYEFFRNYKTVYESQRSYDSNGFPNLNYWDLEIGFTSV